MRFVTLTALALLVAAPAWASRDCVDNADNLNAVLSAQHGTPITLAAYTKIADHPASNDFIFSLGEGAGSLDNALYLLTRATADEYGADARTTTAVGATFAASAGQFDGAWKGHVGEFTGSSQRDVYVDALANTGGNTGTRNVGTALDEIFLCDALNSFAAWNGKIAEVAAWGVALSDADITSYLGGTSADQIDSANLLFYYPLDTTSLDDESGNNETTLTNNGAAFDSDHPTITRAADDFILQRRRLQ